MDTRVTKKVPMSKRKNKLRIMRVGKGTTTNGQPENTRSLKQYFKDLHRSGTLTRDEEKTMLRLYKTTENEDERIAIRNRIITSNQKFIYAIAKRYGFGEHAMDIVDEATITICKNFDKYDPECGYGILTWMSNEIRRTANEYMCRDACHVKQTQNEKILPKARKVYNKFLLEHGYEPDQQTIRDLIENEYGIKVSDETDVMDCVVFSMDALTETDDINDDGHMKYKAIEAVMAVGNDYDKESEKEDIKKAIGIAMANLSDREQKIMSMSSGIKGYYREYDNNEIGAELGLTAERVRQIKKSASDKMAITLNRLGVGLGNIRQRKDYAPAYV